MTQIDSHSLRSKRGTDERCKDQSIFKHSHPQKIKMMFRFYGIAFYFLNNFILVIEIVIVCFKKTGK